MASPSSARDSRTLNSSWNPCAPGVGVCRSPSPQPSPPGALDPPPIRVVPQRNWRHSNHPQGIFQLGSSLFSVELRSEPTAEEKTVGDRLIPSPSPRPLPKGEGAPLGSSGRAECAKAFGRVGDGELPWRRASVRGIEVDIPRTLTKRSHVLPLPGGPGGEGGVRGNEANSNLRRTRIPGTVKLRESSGRDVGFPI